MPVYKTNVDAHVRYDTVCLTFLNCSNTFTVSVFVWLLTLHVFGMKIMLHMLIHA